VDMKTPGTSQRFGLYGLVQVIASSIRLMGPSSQAVDPSGLGGRPGKRRAILDAARRVFFSNGFVQTSVDTIAAEAGVSKQTIYNHFGDKRALFAAVAEAVQAEARGASRFVESGDLEHDLRLLARVLVDAALIKDVVALRRIVIAERAHDPALVEAFARPRSTFDQAFAEEIRRWVRLGVLDVADPALATRQFLLLTVQEAVGRSEYGTHELAPEQVEQIVADGVQMWLRAYRVRV